METDHQEGGNREEPLGFALGAAARKLAKFYAQALAGYPLTPSQLYLLRQLWFEDGLPLRDLGSRAQLDATMDRRVLEPSPAALNWIRRAVALDDALLKSWLAKF